METKGRPKVASLQESTNKCMQWAVVGPPGDERRQTGEVMETGEEGCGRWMLDRTISREAHSLPHIVFVDAVSES